MGGFRERLSGVPLSLISDEREKSVSAPKLLRNVTYELSFPSSCYRIEHTELPMRSHTASLNCPPERYRR